MLMKKWGSLVVFILLLFLDLFVFTGYVNFQLRPPHNREFRTAFWEFTKNRTPYNRAILEAERENYWNAPLTRSIETVDLGVMLAITSLMLFIWKRYRRYSRVLDVPRIAGGIRGSSILTP
jgi:hypothetical protein